MDEKYGIVKDYDGDKADKTPTSHVNKPREVQSQRRTLETKGLFTFRTICTAQPYQLNGSWEPIEFQTDVVTQVQWTHE